MTVDDQYKSLGPTDKRIIDRATCYIYDVDHEMTDEEVLTYIRKLVTNKEKNIFIAIIDALTQ